MWVRRSSTRAADIEPQARARSVSPVACAAGSGYFHRSAFTLVEMVVVVAIILIILGVVLPSTTALWRERRAAETENTIQGLMATTRARAMRTGGVESGIFSYIDDQGAQRLVTIEQDRDHIADPAWQSVFVITADRDHVLPKPVRTVPRYVVNDEPAGQTYLGFSPEELANNDFDNVVNDQSQRHRNYFAVVFSPNGRMLINRDVLIRDEDADEDRVGDRTRLSVGLGGSVDPDTTKYYLPDGSSEDLDPVDPRTAIGHLVIDANNTAINFPTVDGLLVYDDSDLGELSVDERRSFLLRTAQPLYVSRWTGLIIRGPVGEN